MSQQSKRKELAEFREEQKFHEHEWAVQRVGWGVLGAVLVAGIAGAFGSGPLARQVVWVGDTRVEMDRFIRYSSRAEWRFVLDEARTARSLNIYVSSDFISQFEITAISPEPSRTSLTREFVLFEFESDRPIGEIVFHVKPNRAWSHEGFVRVGESSPVHVHQFVYP